MAQTVRIAESRIAAESLRAAPPDLLLRPDVGACPTLAFDRAAAVIRAGWDAAARALAAAGHPLSAD
jgi:predicted acylesterase/phospholipase RssA